MEWLPEQPRGRPDIGESAGHLAGSAQRESSHESRHLVVVVTVGNQFGGIDTTNLAI